MSNTTHPKPHAIVFPYPYHGHITPTINLATKLASNGFTITYVQLEFIHHNISKTQHAIDLFDEARESGLDIRYATISDGFSLEFDRDANLTEYWESMILDFPGRVDELVGSIKKSNDFSGGFFLVADSLYTWTAAIAIKHNLVNVSLWTGSAMVFSISYHLDLLREHGHFPYRGSGVDLINYIPGVESINAKDLMSHILQPDVVPVLNKIILKAFEQFKNVDYILCNTVEEIEPNPLSALNQKKPTFAIGLINFFTEPSPQKRPWLESDCSDWLNSKSRGSVLYISFGSLYQISKQEIMEIAHGLLISRVYFIWVIRTESDQTDFFPSGFLDDVVDRGLLVPWCDQKKVLSNGAVGGFLTHCGWNSVLESVWSGVPMICFPIFVDQPTNRKLVVEDWKIGINLCDEGTHVTRSEVVRKIDYLMKEETNVELREEMKKMSNIMRTALGNDGSSQKNFDQFVNGLKARLHVIWEDGLKN